MAIDHKRIVAALSKIEVAGNQEGLIPAFGVFVNQLPAAFWNSFAERLSRQVGVDLTEAAEYLLVNAAHECGYHTGYGIITSDEWRAVVEPMVEGSGGHSSRSLCGIDRLGMGQERSSRSGCGREDGGARLRLL